MKQLGQTYIPMPNSTKSLRITAFQSGPDVFLELEHTNNTWGGGPLEESLGLVRVVSGYQELLGHEYKRLLEKMTPYQDLEAREKHLNYLREQIAEAERNLESLRTASNIAS